MKGSKGFWIVIGLAALAGGGYYALTQTQSVYAKTVVKLGGARDYAWLLTADKGYVKAWAKALKNGESTFSYKGSKYNAVGGKATV